MKFRNLTKAKLEEEIKELRNTIASLHFDIKSGDLAAVDEYRNAKRDLAKALTVLKERTLGINKKINEPKKEVEIKKENTAKKKVKSSKK